MSHSITSTEELIELWLHERSPRTVASYRRYVEAFLCHAGKPLEQVTLMDVQTWQLSLSGMSANSKRTALAARPYHSESCPKFVRCD